MANIIELAAAGEVIRLDCAETAILVRAALKDAFPGVKFSVKSKTYSGGASIDVTWTDGPTTKQVNQVIRRYERSTFDSMTDSLTYHKPALLNGQHVTFGADHIMGERTLSADLLRECAQAVGNQYGLLAPYVHIKTTTWRGKTSTHAWIDRYGPDSPVVDREDCDYTLGDKALQLAYATSKYTAK